MNKKIKKLINAKDDCDDYLYPDSTGVSDEESKIIENIAEILYHNRFCHEGWLGGYSYQEEAAYFILQYLKELKICKSN